MKYMTKLCGLWIFGMSLIACMTDASKSSSLPEVTEETSVQDLVSYAVKYGGKTYTKALAVIQKRRSYTAANKVAGKIITEGLTTMKPGEIANLVRMYRETAGVLDKKVFVSLVFSDVMLARQMGWQLAAVLPSRSTANLVDDALSLILAEGNEKSHFIPQMAQAVAANHLTSSYKVLKVGLLQNGDDTFAKAMIALNPTRASADFLDYLALAPIEDLRQLKQTSINVITAYVVLNHLVAVHPPVDHPKYEHLFFFAVSRNQGLSELARVVLEHGYEKDRARLAFVLARLPGWIQVSFVEGLRRNLNPNVRGFLAELRKLTVQADVLEELQAINL